MTKDEAQRHPVYRWMCIISDPAFHDEKNCKGPMTDSPKLQAVYEMCEGEGTWTSGMVKFLQDIGAWKLWSNFAHNQPKEWMSYDTRVKYVNNRRMGSFAIVLAHLDSLLDSPSPTAANVVDA